MRQKNQNKKNGLLIIKFPYETAWGGEEFIHLLLAKKLREKGYKTALLSSCPYLYKAFKKNSFYAKKFWFLKTDPVSKFSLLIFPITGFFLFLSGIFWLIYFRLKGYKKILLLRLQEKILFTAIAKIFGFKIFWAEHTGFGKWLYKNPLLPFYKFFSKSTTFIVPSSEMKKQVESVIKNPKIEVLANAISTRNEQCFDKLSMTKEKKLEQINNKNFDLFIGYAGRLSKEKGLFFLLNLAEKIIKKYPNKAFLIAGKGSLKNELKNIIKEKKLDKNIFLLGFLSEEELNIFYKSLDIFCLFSDHETFGISILEAMNTRLPIIANNTGAISELIKNNQNGFLIEKNNLDEAFEKLEKLTNNEDLRKKFALESKKIFEENYSEEKFLDKAEKIFFK